MYVGLVGIARVTKGRITLYEWWSDMYYNLAISYGKKQNFDTTGVLVMLTKINHRILKSRALLD